MLAVLNKPTIILQAVFISVAALLLFVLLVPSELVADPGPVATPRFLENAQQEELRSLLEVGLKPASAQQAAFLDKIVELVGEGRLPLEMVEGTFIWARRQSGWAYPYFEQALRLRARRAGIKI